MIRSPLAVTVGHGLTGPPCSVGESVPCSSGLLIPWLRMTGHKRRPHAFGGPLTRPPFGWSFSGFILIDRGYLAGHARTLAVVMAWKCSHVRPFLRVRLVTHQGAPRGGHRCFGFLSWLEFLGAGFWRSAGAVPILRRCEVVPLATCPANDLPV